MRLRILLLSSARAEPEPDPKSVLRVREIVEPVRATWDVVFGPDESVGAEPGFQAKPEGKTSLALAEPHELVVVVVVGAEAARD